MGFDYQIIRKHTIGKLVVMSLSILAPILAFIIIGNIYDDLKPAKAIDMQILRISVLVILECIIASKLYKYIRILASEGYAKKVYIKRQDERIVYIRQRTMSFTMKLVIYLLCLAMVITGFISSIIFYTLGSVIGVLAIIYFLTLLYFSKKI